MKANAYWGYEGDRGGSGGYAYRGHGTPVGLPCTPPEAAMGMLRVLLFAALYICYDVGSAGPCPADPRPYPDSALPGVDDVMGGVTVCSHTIGDTLET